MDHRKFKEKVIFNNVQKMYMYNIYIYKIDKISWTLAQENKNEYHICWVSTCVCIKIVLLMGGNTKDHANIKMYTLLSYVVVLSSIDQGNDFKQKMLVIP